MVSGHLLIGEPFKKPAADCTDYHGLVLASSVRSLPFLLRKELILKEKTPMKSIRSVSCARSIRVSPLGCREN
jgi:hypothetical protein